MSGKKAPKRAPKRAHGGQMEEAEAAEASVEDPKNDEKILEIIHEMRDKEVLHNIAHKRYKIDHNLAIDNVAKKLNMTSKDVTDKIRYIKRQYRSCLLELRHKAGVTGRSGAGLEDLSEPEESPETSKKLWKWFRQCEFLNSSVHRRVNKESSKIPKMPNYNALTEIQFTTDNSNISGAGFSGGQLADDTQDDLPVNEIFSTSVPPFSTDNSSWNILSPPILTPVITPPETSPRSNREYSNIDHEMSFINSRSISGTQYTSQQEIEVFSNQWESPRFQSPDVFLRHDRHDHLYATKIAKTSSESSSAQALAHTNELKSFLHKIVEDRIQDFSNSSLLKIIHDMTLFLDKFKPDN